MPIKPNKLTLMDFTARFKALHYKEENVGKLIKSSKQKFTWEFKMNSKHCFLNLKVSKVTNNYSVELNKQLLYKGNKSYDENFEFKFKIEGIMLSIKMHGSKYVLYIQHIPFKEFYEGEKARQTRLVRPEPVLNSEDFDVPSPEKRFKSMNSKPVKPRFVDKMINNSTPLTALNKNRSIKDADDLANDNKKIEEWMNDKRKNDEMTIKLQDLAISEKSIEEDINPFEGDEIRGRGQTFEFKGYKTGGLEICNEVDCEVEENNNGDEEDIGDPTLKESMDIVVFPCDFDDKNANTEKVIQVLYAK